MTAKWLILNLGNPDHIHKLYYAVMECGRGAEVITLGDVSKISESTNLDSDCVVCCGSIWTNTTIKLARPNWIGNFHDRNTFLCSSYYSHWGKYLTQKRYCMMTFAEVIRNADFLYDTLGIEGSVFIRPDSGEKEFPGELVHKDRFRAWKDGLLNLHATTLCVISQPVKIAKEYRLVIAKREVVTGSAYKVAKHIAYEPLDIDEDMTRVVDFAHQILADNPPPLPPFHVLDIAVEDDGNLSVLEVGCFCCSGLYECDRKKIANKISEVAEEQYANREIM